MKKIFCLSVLLAFNYPAFAYNSQFMSGEHIYFGDKVGIRLSDAEPPQTSFNITLRNGASMSYGEIMAAGDHYGFEDVPIFAGATIEEREVRFRNAFNQLDAVQATFIEIPKIREVLQQEIKSIQDAMSKGIPASVAYVAVSDETDRQLNCITGGWCHPKTWWMKMGRTTRLSTVNFDHFGDNAWLTYEAGHRAAMKEAIQARDNHDLSLLRHAYAMNAFASHFLADRYASGHIRVPRVPMSTQVRPAIVGSLLMRYMHDEENEGLNVHDSFGNHWRAVGDGYYFDNEHTEHSRRIVEALQASAEEVYAAYKYGKLIDGKRYGQLPLADEYNRICDHDRAQLFMWEPATEVLYRRYNLRNKNDCNWTRFWFGWTTLIELHRIHKHNHLSVANQAALAKSEYAQEAVREGLISNENIINYVRLK